MRKRAQDHYRARMLSVAWEEWLVQVQHRRTLASALALWQGKLVQDAFGRWLHYVELSRAKRHSMTKVLFPHTGSQHSPKQCFSSSILGASWHAHLQAT